MSGTAVKVGAQSARSHALAVLRVRGRATALALLPAAVAVVLFAGDTSGFFRGPGWDAVRWVVAVVAAVALLAAVVIGLVVARSRPAVSPTVPVSEEAAPDLYRLVRDLADQLGVPAPSAIALTPDCDSWLEDRTHPAHATVPRGRATRGPGGGEAGGAGRADCAGGGARDGAAAPVLVIGSPFLWWMRVAELRAVLAPVVAGTGPAAHPDIAAARRFVRGLDAAVAGAAAPGRGAVGVVSRGAGSVARLLLDRCRGHAAEMERGVAAAAAHRAQGVDHGLRVAAQEQVGLAYAGWDRLLTRVALPAWRMGRWPAQLDVGVVAALTELSRRDRLAEGFTSRLAERPACDLLEEPGTVDESTSLLAAHLFHGGPAQPGPDWTPVDWQEYPDEVVDRAWRLDAARLHRVLDRLGIRHPQLAAGGTAVSTAATVPTLARVMLHLTTDEAASEPSSEAGTGGAASEAGVATRAEAAHDSGGRPSDAGADAGAGELPVAEGALPGAGGASAAGGEGDEGEGGIFPEELSEAEAFGDGRGAELAAGISAELAREEATSPRPASDPPPGAVQGPDEALQFGVELPMFPVQPPRSGRDLLVDHITATVCCAAVDTAGAEPGLDWLDGPALLVGGERAKELPQLVTRLVEAGDAEPLRDWLARHGIRSEKPIRLV
ncbi:hypothetical protein [Streptomyces sp. NPDC058045]|uniref:hypothetical protein n=1 Tax=Streptomyces sp. NPDC058045 TaxID=3346311 RepID=UPI0036E0911E